MLKLWKIENKQETSSDTDVHVSFSLSEAIKVSDILSHHVVSFDSTVLFGSLKSSGE
jgi:hypothetical protein